MGGVTHCAGMCGPFVLSQTATMLDVLPLKQVSNFTRLRGAALLPYHAGRMTTYAILGFVAALFSARFRALPWFSLFSAGLLAIAGLLFLMSACASLKKNRCEGAVPSETKKIHEVFFSSLSFGFLRPLFASPRGWRGYFLGLILGLLPCGLVYAALLSAASRGDPLTAIEGMLLFAIGTTPALVIVGIGGHLAFLKFRSALRYVFPLLMFVNSLTLFAMAGELVK